MSTDWDRILKECSVSEESEATTGDDGDREPQSLLEVYLTRGDVIKGRAFFGEIASSYMAKGVAIRGIVSNDVESYPEDGPEGMKDQASRAGWTFPYLQDRDQSFAKHLGAVCTPDLFLFDRDNVLVYRGAFDESSPKNGVPLTGDHLIRALDFTLEGSEVPLPHRRAIGCSIKWIPQA